MVAAWTDATIQCLGKLEVDWQKNGTWINETANLLSAGGGMALLMPWEIVGGVNAQQPWTATFELKNTADRYSASNAGGNVDVIPYIANNKGHGVPIRFSMGLGDWASPPAYTYTRVFTGYIDKLTVTSTADDLARFECIDNSAPLLQMRQTTTMYLDQTTDAWIDTLADLGGVASLSLSAGLRVIPYCWLDDEQLWVEINKAAHSEGGFVYFDRTGTLVFENCEDWLVQTRHTGVQATFAVTRWQDMSPEMSWDGIYNRVIAQYQPRAQRGKQEVWKLETSEGILPNQTRVIVARLRYPCTAVWEPVANVDYKIISEIGDDLTAKCTIVTDKHAQRVTITIEHDLGSPTKTAYVYSFRLLGCPLIGYTAGQVQYDATDSDIGNPTTGEAKVLTLTGNEYVQTWEQANLLAVIMRDRIKLGRQLYHVKNMPAIPTLIPGDKVTVVETGSGVNASAFITAIRWTYNQGKGSYVGDYDCLDCTSWFPYASDDYFTLGTDVLGSPSNRVFY